MKRYNPTEIEQKWQQKWEEDGTYKTDLDDTRKPKYVGFSMLPGITGAGIHIGHGRTFQFSDIKVRAKRQQGFSAYHPIGWDSFGLPVENYAIKVGKTPREAHDEAKSNFIRQLKRLGFSYDWSKEISTADPGYYKWTQWIFNQLYKNDLAYQKESAQWWCETDQTVLANEQVEGGKCWRCGNSVTKKNLKQWFFRITAYADEMLEATDDLNWTEMVKTMQKNWIGRSQGAKVDFVVDGSGEKITVFTTRPDTLFGATFMVLAPEHELVAQLATPEQKADVEAYQKATAAKSDIERMVEDKEKTGVFTGSYAINPVNGEKIPIWIADYVLSGYGTGAIMAVPAHDERDGAFAKKFDLPIKQVIAPYKIYGGNKAPRDDVETVYRPTIDAVITDGNGRYLLQVEADNHIHFVGGGIEGSDATVEDAVRREVEEEVGFTDIKSIHQVGPFTSGLAYRNGKNRNQQTWGAFYEVVVNPDIQVHSEIDDGLHTVKWVDKADVMDEITWEFHKEGWQYVLDGQIIPEGVFEGVLVNSGAFDGIESSQAREEVTAWLEQQGVGRSTVQYKMRDWLISRQRYWGAPIPMVHVDGYAPIAVADHQLPVELPTVEDFKPKGGNTSVLAEVDDWVRVWVNVKTGETKHISEPKPDGDDWHEGKRETDTMDGYACSSWYFLRYIDPFNDDEAWSKQRANHWEPIDFYNGADHAVAHLLYSRFWMRFFYKQGLVPTPEPFKRMMYNAYIMAPDGQKMSKSKGNVIDPMEIMDSGYGADSLRLYEMFIAPYDMDAPWDTRGVPGTYRFLSRVWTLAQEYIEAEAGQSTNAEAIDKVAHGVVKKVTSDIEDEKFNTAVAAMMEAVNEFYKLKDADGGIKQNDSWKFALEGLLQVLAPFAPHITEELWHELGHEDTIHVDHWPKWDDSKLVSNTMTLAVQVNGKLRGEIAVKALASEDDIKSAALALPGVQKHLPGEPKKVIYVKNRLVSVVV